MNIVRSAIVATAAAAVALVPTAANADTKGHHDSVGDMRSVAFDPTTGRPTPTPSTAEPAAKLGDVSKVTVGLTARTLTLKLKYRELIKAGYWHVHEFDVAYPGGSRLVEVEAFRGHWGGKTTVRKPNRKKVSCSAHAKIDYGRNKVTVKVPTRCIGHAKVVKVGAAALIAYGSKIFYDDGFTTGGEFTDNFVLGPKVHR